MKKWYNTVFILFLAGFLLYGCSEKTPENSSARAKSPYSSPVYDWEEGGNETLTLWAQEPDLDRVYMKRAIKNYEKTTGNHIEITQIPKDEFYTRVIDAFNGKTKAPDLLLTYGGANIDPFMPDENLYDFSDAVWVDDLTDTSINQSVYHGKIIGLPHWEASVSGTIYNKQIFKELNLQVPKNQKEFMEACKKLMDNDIIPVYMPFVDSSMMLYQFPLDTIVEDSDTLEELNAGSIGYSDMPKMRKIVDWYKTMAECGYFGKNYKDNSWDGMNDALKSGKYAMMLCWDTWLYTDFDGDASDFGLMPAFMGIPEDGTFEGPNLALVTVNKHSNNLDSAINFVTFMADPYNYNKAFDGIYTAPVFKQQVNSISTPQYTESERIIDRNYHDSTAWLRIRGFSQTDADCIQDYMQSSDMTFSDCLEAMDQLRIKRIESAGQ